MKTTIKYKIDEATAKELAFNCECPVFTEQTFEFDAVGHIKHKLLSAGAIVNAQEGTMTLNSPYLYCIHENRRKWKERELSYLLNEENVEFFIERLEAAIIASKKYAEDIEKFEAIVGKSMGGTIVHAVADGRISEEDLRILVGIADEIACMPTTFLEEKFNMRGYVEDTLRARVRETIIDSLDVEAAREIKGSHSKWMDDEIILLERELQEEFLLSEI